MENKIPVSMGAEAFVEMLNANGVDYIFLNPGTDTWSVQEAVCKFKALGKRTPEVILSLHESVAMAAAHGHFMMSGKPQVVLVHADLGPQQVGGALHNAQRGRIGVILCSGKVPTSTEAGRVNHVHWLQDQFDQAGVVRGYVKWNYELRSNKNIHEVVQRAFQVASSEPCGPVYLCLPMDLLSEKLESVRIPEVSRYSPVETPQADSALLEKAATLLAGAENPLIIAGYSGRNAECVASLVELSEVLGARVVSTQVRMNFPTTHPLHGGFDSRSYIRDADVVLFVDEDVPYIPAHAQPAPETKIIHIDIDPLKQTIPMWGFPVDLSIQADSSKALPILCKRLKHKLTPRQKARIKPRVKRIGNENRELKAQWLKMATGKASQKPISPDWLSYCVSEAIGEDAVVLVETVTNGPAVMRQAQRTRPGTIFYAGGSNLGWGLGAALGAKLAFPDKTFVALVGDGSFVFGCPTAALWAACVHKAAFLCVIYNNTQYTAPKMILREALGTTSYSEKTGMWTGTAIRPAPDYAAIACACGAWGKMVDEPAEIKPALKAALKQVHAGKPAVLDVRVEAPC